MNKNNYILLGMAISYILIAVFQIRIDGVLSATVYITIAFVSLEFTFFEMLKNVISYRINGFKKLNMMVNSRKEFLEKSLKVYSKFGVLDDEINILKEELEDLPNYNNSFLSNKKIKSLTKLASILSCLQIIICTLQIMIMPLLSVPYNAITNKVINVLTLISFAMMFLSYFFSSNWNDFNNITKEKWEILEIISNAYLEILDKIESDDKQIDV